MAQRATLSVEVAQIETALETVRLSCRVENGGHPYFVLYASPGDSRRADTCIFFDHRNFEQLKAAVAQADEFLKGYP